MQKRKQLRVFEKLSYLDIPSGKKINLVNLLRTPYEKINQILFSISVCILELYPRPFGIKLSKLRYFVER